MLLLRAQRIWKITDSHEFVSDHKESKHSNQQPPSPPAHPQHTHTSTFEISHSYCSHHNLNIKSHPTNKNIVPKTHHLLKSLVNIPHTFCLVCCHSNTFCSKSPSCLVVIFTAPTSSPFVQNDPQHRQITTSVCLSFCLSVGGFHLPTGMLSTRQT